MKRLYILAAAALLVSSCSLQNLFSSEFESRVAALENKEGGRIGVAVLDTETGERLNYNADERFALCSTHKLLLAAAVLARIDAGHDALTSRITFNNTDILAYAPVTKKFISQGNMSVAELAEASIAFSDNTAANLLSKRIGGPVELTRFMRALGDDITRLDRMEPELNSNYMDDARDTTTPSAMVNSMQKILVGKILSDPSRTLLTTWLVRNTTGAKKLRAGIPANWMIGDKTGSGSNGASSDVAAIWPNGKKPLLVAVYYTGSDGNADQQAAVIAEVGRIITSHFKH